MNKSLKDMTSGELWQLFPIIITEHNPEWKERYSTEKELLTTIIGSGNIVRINHIGSTAVPGLLAKPTIDVLIEINEQTNTGGIIHIMESNGYIYSPQPTKPPPYMLFMKGYTTEGFKGQAYHIHIRYPGDWDELYFRDYLLLHPDKAKEYGELKLRLKEKYEHDRDAYTVAKTGFIKKTTEIARNNNLKNQ